MLGSPTAATAGAAVATIATTTASPSSLNRLCPMCYSSPSRPSPRVHFYSKVACCQELRRLSRIIPVQTGTAVAWRNRLVAEVAHAAPGVHLGEDRPRPGDELGGRHSGPPVGDELGHDMSVPADAWILGARVPPRGGDDGRAGASTETLGRSRCRHATAGTGPPAGEARAGSVSVLAAASRIHPPPDAGHGNGTMMSPSSIVILTSAPAAARVSSTSRRG